MKYSSVTIGTGTENDSGKRINIASYLDGLSEKARSLDFRPNKTSTPYTGVSPEDELNGKYLVI